MTSLYQLGLNILICDIYPCLFNVLHKNYLHLTSVYIYYILYLLHLMSIYA